jgi:hypothetical protein
MDHFRLVRPLLALILSSAACGSSDDKLSNIPDGDLPCQERPIVSCSNGNSGQDLAPGNCDPGLAACPFSQDGCQKATYRFNGDGCLVESNSQEWRGTGPCLEAALKDKRWPVFAGKTITVRESCMPGIGCSVDPGTFGRARSR